MTATQDLLEDALESAVKHQFGLLFSVLVIDPSHESAARFSAGLQKLIEAEAVAHNVIDAIEKP